MNNVISTLSVRTNFAFHVLQFAYFHSTNSVAIDGDLSKEKNNFCVPCAQKLYFKKEMTLGTSVYLFNTYENNILYII